MPSLVSRSALNAHPRGATCLRTAQPLHAGSSLARTHSPLGASRAPHAGCVQPTSAPRGHTPKLAPPASHPWRPARTAIHATPHRPRRAPSTRKVHPQGHSNAESLHPGLVNPTTPAQRKRPVPSSCGPTEMLAGPYTTVSLALLTLAVCDDTSSPYDDSVRISAICGARGIASSDSVVMVLATGLMETTASP